VKCGPKNSRTSGLAATPAKASAPSEPTAISSAASRAALSIRTGSAGQEAAMMGASVVSTEIGTKCERSSRLYTAP
jgi:hypothetical protein